MGTTINDSQNDFKKLFCGHQLVGTICGHHLWAPCVGTSNGHHSWAPLMGIICGHPFAPMAQWAMWAVQGASWVPGPHVQWTIRVLGPVGEPNGLTVVASLTDEAFRIQGGA